MNLNERIKEARMSTGLSQVKFGARIGVGSSGMSKLESGENNPSDQTIKLICSEFGISRKWLETGEGEMKAPDPTAVQMVLRVMRGQNEYAKQVMAAFATLDDGEWEQLKELVDKLKKAGL